MNLRLIRQICRSALVIIFVLASTLPSGAWAQTPANSLAEVLHGQCSPSIADRRFTICSKNLRKLSKQLYRQFG